MALANELSAVIFQISQIGSDQSAREFLKDLAERSEKDKSLYCTDRMWIHLHYNVQVLTSGAFPERLDDKLSENEYNLEQWVSANKHFVSYDNSFPPTAYGKKLTRYNRLSC